VEIRVAFLLYKKFYPLVNLSILLSRWWLSYATIEIHTISPLNAVLRGGSCKQLFF